MFRSVRSRSGRGVRGDPSRQARALRACLAAVAVALTITLLPARTLTVDDDGPADFRMIQAAIDAALAGDVVAVAAGTYRENVRLKSGVTVMGAGSAVTIIDGGRLGSVARLTDCDAAARLEGFRLTGGQARLGGGVRIERGSPVVRFNEIVGNSAVPGGSYLYSYGGGVAVLQSAAEVSDNLLSSNVADYGGGLHLEGGSPRITRNVITGNTAGAGGGVDAYVLFGTGALIAANTITSNSAAFGGGLELGGTGAPVLTNNLILGNNATASGAGTGFGGGADAYYSNAQFLNNTLAGNTARTGGGAAILADGSARLAGNIFLENEASSAGGALVLDAPGAAVLGNIFHLSTGGTCSGSSAFLCADPSNQEIDPLLVDPAGGNYRPRPGSPAIDSAPAAGAPTDDLRGQRRPLDGNGDDIPAHDAGAFEFDRDAVLGLELTREPAGGTRLSWQPVSGAAGYHVYSGAFSGRLERLPDSCRDADDDNPADRSFLEALDPLPGHAFAYLVTAVTAAGEQSPGFDFRGVERHLPLPCP